MIKYLHLLNQKLLSKKIKPNYLMVLFLSINVNVYSLETNLSKQNTDINKLKTQQIEIKGTVSDALGPIPGVNVSLVGTARGTATDFDGNYIIKANKGDVLKFSYVGYKTATVVIGNSNTVNITLAEDLASLDEVVVVGFGTQKKKTVVGAISTIKPSELKVPASNLTTALAGRISGVVSYQTSGEPGADNAQFFVRGVASFNNQNGPLILIDSVELTADDLARLQPDDIESFSILKDPTTTAIYGARGANGIILVTTKQGTAGAPKIRLRVESAFSSPVSTPDIADPFTYISLQNEAARTRGDLAPFTLTQVAGVRDGLNPNVFPTTDWNDELFKDFTVTQRVNLNVSGGGDIVKYYVAGSLNKDNGLLKVDPINNFNNNIDLRSYSFRSNINIDLSENIEMIVRLNSTLDDYRGPLVGGNDIYRNALRTSPVRFPAVFDLGQDNGGFPFILFGNSSSGRGNNGLPIIGGSEAPVWFNPYAELQRGYRDRKRQLNLVQLEFKQKLDFITEGLSARFLGNINSTGTFANNRAYTPYYFEVGGFDPANPDDFTLDLIGDGGDETLSYSPSGSENVSIKYMEAAINYARTFNEKHGVTGLLVMIGRDYQDGQASNLQLSLPSRNIGVSGRFSYSYKDRYFAEFNFGYNGSERFAKSSRFGFFPSYGVGWLVSDEPFFKSSVIDRLKLRASYGFIGNDRIGNTREDRFFYLSEVNLRNNGRGYTFGNQFDNFTPGVSISRYANPQVTWELAEKVNLGLETSLFNSAVALTVDAFHETRSNILQDRQDVPSTLGLAAGLQTNVGEVKAWGLDGSLDINHSFNKDTWLTGRGTYTYTDNEFTIFEEPNYAAIDAPWRSRIGDNVSQSFGYVAERLFIDDEDAINSPTQLTGAPGVDYGAGDIKYVDLNGDGQITELDRTAIGNPTVPKITYGFGLSAGHKRWDLNIFFQGLDQTSFLVNPRNVGPFINTAVGGARGENALLQHIADNHWSLQNNDPYAQWPRLSLDPVSNNEIASSYWLRNGSFLRLKQVEVGFNLIDENNDFGLRTLRLYATGTNLHVWSKFKQWDPELRGNGYNYPLQQVINLGVQIEF